MFLAEWFGQEGPMVDRGSAPVVVGVDRGLSPSERWFWIIDQISPSNCVARVRVWGSVGAGEIERAWDVLAGEYPLLRVGVVDPDGGDPRFVTVGARIPVRRVEAEDPELWQREVDFEVVHPITVEHGVARVVDVVGDAGHPGERHDLILTVSHTVMDGRSLLTVLRKLVEYLALERDSFCQAVAGAGVDGSRRAAVVGPGSEGSRAADAGSSVRSAGPEPGAGVPPGATGPGAARAAVPASDDLIPAGARGFWRYVYSNLADQVVAMALRPRRLTGAVPLGLGERRTRAVYRVIGGADLGELVAECRRAGVSVHGALGAATARTIGESVRPGRGGVAGIGSPVDFRPLLRPRPDDDELGIYAPVLAGFVRFGPGISLWAMARSVNRQLEKGIRRRRHLSAVAGMRFGTPRTVESGRRVVELIDRRAPWNVSVTNVGRVDFPERVGALRLSDLTLAASNSCVSALTVAIVTAHDEMRISFCYVDGVLSRSEADTFADRVVRALTCRPAPAVV
ncbi:phthiocerol/phthiodiolone dimycocerosyl transferase family protein [Nocardia jejuensis]|uniref:phthiocerol/phthiodiolone dimycocerosyl transferase family protein n=1 Tax=Nocardia jejuensis TaxID=328049 RepID=UPI000831565D|nr:hypothetical protein [Nocardia jejuensis]